MAQDPNALGAPAEGFGQTVSFAFDPRGETPQINPITSRGPQVGAQNVSQQQRISTNVPIETKQDPTAALLMKAGEALLSKSLDKSRTEQFVQGMQRAMSGEAIQEVQDSIPWYAKVFGDTPTLEGARAYSAQDRVNKALTEQTSSIPSIAGLGPDAAAKHFTAVVNKSLTGDSATDLIIMKQMTEQLPSLMKAQAKANYSFNQHAASKAMSDSIGSGAAALQQYGEMYASDQVNDKDMAIRKDNFVLNVLPPAGIDEENYQKTLTSNMLGMAAAGQFHAIEALREKGVTKALTAEQSNRVEAAILSSAAKARDNYAFKFTDAMAALKSDAAHPGVDPETGEGMTPRSISDRIDRMNSAFQKLTGSPVGLYTSDQKADMLAGTFNAFKAEEVKAAGRMQVLTDQKATESAKALAAAETESVIRNLVASGDVGLAEKLPGVSNDAVDLEIYKQAKADLKAATPFLRNIWAKGKVSSLIADELQAPLKLAAASFAQNPTSPPPDGFFAAVNTYRAMTQAGGMGFANAYFGEQAKTLSYASYMLKDNVLANPQAPAIYQQAMRAKDFRGEPLAAKEQQELVSKVASEGRNWISKATLGYSGHQLREDAVRFLSDDVKEGVSQWMAAGLSKEEATASAINDALGPDTAGGRRGGARGEVLGGYYIRRDPASSQESISELMQGGKNTPFTAVPEEIRGEVFNRFLKESVKLPDDLGTTTMNRLPDVAGTPQFVVSAVDKDGKTTIRTFTGTQLQTFAADATKHKRLDVNGNNRPMTPAEISAWNADYARRKATPVVPIKLQWGPQFAPENPNGFYGDAAARARAAQSEDRKASSSK